MPQLEQLPPSFLRVRCFTFCRGRFFGWVVRYTGGTGDEAEIAPDDGGRVYLCRGAVESYERLWWNDDPRTRHHAGVYAGADEAMSYDIAHADILEWIARYDGPLKFDTVNIKLPEYQELIAMFGSTIQFAPVVCNVAVLNGRQVIGLIETWIGMPERTVNFNQGIDRWKVKIIAIAAQSILLLIGNPHAIKSGGELLFKQVMGFAGVPGGDLIGGQLGMALARFIRRKLALICSANLLSCFWGMCATMHTVFSAVVCLASTHIYIRDTQYSDNRPCRAPKSGSDLDAIHPVLVHRDYFRFISVDNLCIFFTSTLSRTKLSTSCFFITFKRRR